MNVSLEIKSLTYVSRDECNIFDCIVSDTDGEHLTFIVQLRNSIWTMNLYRKKQENQRSEESPTREQMLTMQRQQVATRYYAILLVIAIAVILLCGGLSLRKYSVTVSSPTESTFELLQARYSSTFSCPCSYIAIPYSKFLSVQPSVYHQVCSSYFSSADFFKLAWGSESFSRYFWHIDAKILSSQFRLLSSLCSLAKDAINQRIKIFSSQELISMETLTRHSFQSQIDSIITSFILQTPANFQRNHRYIIEMLRTNQLQNIFYTNWNVTISDSNNNYIMSTYPIWYNESGDSCSCATSSICSRSTFALENIRGKIPGKRFFQSIAGVTEYEGTCKRSVFFHAMSDII